MGINTVSSDELDMTCLGSPTGPGMVRTLVEMRLNQWGLTGIVEDVVLIAGELVANAVEAAPYREIGVQFRREAGAVLLGVWDCSDAMPLARPIVELCLDDIVPDARALDPGHDDQTGGWGLPIVAALASECGVRATPPRGKWVWARYAFGARPVSGP